MARIQYNEGMFVGPSVLSLTSGKAALCVLTYYLTLQQRRSAGSTVSGLLLSLR